MKKRERPVEIMVSSPKYRPPRQLPKVITRREIDKIAESVQERLITLIIAPSGYGKTTVMARWWSQLIVEKPDIAWLSLDQDDEDGLTFVDNICAAFRTQCQVNVETYTINNKAFKDRGHDSKLDSLMASIQASDRSYVLFLDDLQWLKTESAVNVLEDICKIAPDNLSFVMASRRDLPDYFNGLISQGQMFVVDVQMLAFSLDETTSFLRVFGRADLTLAHIDQLHHVTEGWVSGLHLACHALKKSKSLSVDIARFSGETSVVSNFIWNTMILDLPEKDLSFLEKLSLLATFTPESCKYIIRDPEAKSRLKRLAVQIPFIICLDEFTATYRLHSLLQNFLYVRIDGQNFHAFHLRAFEYFSETKNYTEAINHALHINEQDWALTLIKECARDVISTGEFSLISRWIERISVKRAVESLALQKDLCIAYCVYGQKQKARECLDHIHKLVTERRNEKRLPDVAIIEIAIIEATYHVVDEKLSSALDLIQKYNFIQANIDPWLKAIGCNIMAMCNSYLSHTEEIRKYLTLARTYHEDTKGHLRQVYSLCYYGVLAEAEGKISEADTYFRSAFDQVIADKQERGMPAVHVACFMLPSLYERGRFSEMRVLIANRIHGALYNVMTMIMVPAIVAYINMRFTMNNIANAESLLDEFEGRANADSIRYAQSFILLIKLDRCLLKNNISAFKAIIEQYHTLLQRCHDSDPVIKGILDDHKLFILAKQYVFLGEGGEIVKKIAALCQRLSMGGTRRDLLKGMIHYALCLSRRDGITAAKDVILDAVKLGSSLGYTQSFVDLLGVFPNVEKLLKSILLDESLSQTDKMFVQIVFKINQDQKQQSHSESNIPRIKLVRVESQKRCDIVLSDREQDILGYVSSGYTNKEIALALSITIETVKWHLKQVFQKLGAQNRTHAVKQAKIMGLLDPP